MYHEAKRWGVEDNPRGVSGLVVSRAHFSRFVSWLWWPAGGILLALPFLFDNLLLLALPGFMFWLHGLETRQSGLFWRGLVGGFVFVFTALAWLFELGFLFQLITAAVYAPYFGVFAWTTGRLRHRLEMPNWITAPLVIYFTEILLEHVTLFPVTWLHLGYLLWQHPVFMQVAELGGVSLISAQLVLVAGSLYQLGRSLVSLRNAVWRSAHALLPVLVTLVVLLVAYGYGHVRLNNLELQPLLKVALVQANIPQTLRTQDRNAIPVITRHANLSLTVQGQDVGLVIWPESAIRYFLEKSENIQNYLGELTREIKAPILLGAIGLNEAPAPPSNSAFLIDSEGRLAGRADKTVLVPCAETLPVIEHVPFIRKAITDLLSRTMHFRPHLTAGPEPGLVQVLGHRVGLMICYDDAVPGPSADLKQRGAEALITLSNEAWFADRELTQHVAMATARCIENRLPMARATHTGETCLIDPAGRITDRLPRRLAGVLVGTMQATNAYAVPAPVRQAVSMAVVAVVLAALTWSFRQDRKKQAHK